MLQMLTSIFITVGLTIGLLFINFAVTTFTLLTISLAYLFLVLKTKINFFQIVNCLLMQAKNKL